MSSSTPSEVAEVSEDAAEAISGSAASSGDGGSVIDGFDLSGLGEYGTKAAKYLLKSFEAKSDGVSVERVREEYPVGDGPALMVRAVTRAVGVDDVPPPAEFIIGVVKTAKDGWK